MSKKRPAFIILDVEKAWDGSPITILVESAASGKAQRYYHPVYQSMFGAVKVTAPEAEMQRLARIDKAMDAILTPGPVDHKEILLSVLRASQNTKEAQP